MSSVHAVERAAVRVILREDGFGVGASWQLADCPPGHSGWPSQRQGHAVPQQHQQGGRAAALQHFCFSVWKGADGRCSFSREWSWGDCETWDIWKQTSAEARYQWTLHTSDGVLMCLPAKLHGWRSDILYMLHCCKNQEFGRYLFQNLDCHKSVFVKVFWGPKPVYTIHKIKSLVGAYWSRFGVLFSFGLIICSF